MMPQFHANSSSRINGSFRNRILCSAIASVVGLGGFNVATSRAALITPAGLTPGTTFRYIYVTTLTTAGTSTDTTTYDTVAANDAAALGNSTYNGAAVTWQALVSTDSETANAKLVATDPFYTLGGAEVAPNSAALFNTTTVPLMNPIGSTAADVWTGTGSDGTEALAKGMGDSGTFINGPYNSEYGVGNATDSTWLSVGDDLADTTTLPIYAYSSELTVPVPEPTTLALLAVAAVPVVIRRRKNTW